jgi:hypothetical protein
MVLGPLPQGTQRSKFARHTADENKGSAVRSMVPAATVPHEAPQRTAGFTPPRSQPRRLPLPLTDAATSSLVYSAPRHWIELPAVIANQVGTGSWLQVSDSLEPVTRTVHSALDRLRQSLPASDAQEMAPQAQRWSELRLYARTC